MPFGTRPDAAGKPVDFNRVYAEYIRPALEAAGLEVLRVDGETGTGDMRTDLFQELLLADLVVADLTTDDPKVWYELGVRHALRARGVVLVCGGRATSVFDRYTGRRLGYGLREGAPDPATLPEDRRRLTEMVRSTMESWHGPGLSPVYRLLPGLREPHWRSLRADGAQEFWARHDAWARRVDRACRAGQIGDVLVLADEAPAAAFRAEAWTLAGQALREAGRFDFALEQLERGLAIEPDNLRGLREQGICLQQLAMAGAPGHSLERAREHYRGVLGRYPGDAETWALLGRVDRDAWTAAWRRADRTPEQMRDAATAQEALLRAAVDSYAGGFRRSPAHYRCGVNALVLMHLHRHLTGDARHDHELTTMAGAVRFAAQREPDPARIFRARISLGDLEVLTGTPENVKSAYRQAITSKDGDWLALDSGCARLRLLQDLGLRPDTVAAGIAAFERALQGLTQPAQPWQPRQVLLFSGHLIDAPDRLAPRFPAAKEPIAAQRIAQALEDLAAGPDDMALTQGACGGDILFTEACLQRGVRMHWLQPFLEPEFMERSVVCGGEVWRERYLDLRDRLAAPPRAAPTELGEPPHGAGEGCPYERCNRWLLYAALARGVDRVRLVCLWDGGGGDGPGGTAHMYGEVWRRTGRVTWIDTRQL
jgi:tetratricopeptide (TPR) repeat protein